MVFIVHSIHSGTNECVELKSVSTWPTITNFSPINHATHTLAHLHTCKAHHIITVLYITVLALVATDIVNLIFHSSTIIVII